MAAMTTTSSKMNTTAPFITAATTSIVSKITLSPPKVTGVGGKVIAIKYLNSNLMIRMPEMMCWGIDEKEFDGKSKMSFTLQFPTNDKYNTAEIEAALQNFKEFEEFIKQQAIVNSKEWLNKGKVSMDVIDALFTPILRRPRNEAGEPNMEKPPSLNIKIPAWDGRIDSEVFDSDGNMIFPNSTGTTLHDLIPKQTVLSTLITCGGVWFAGGKFGVTFKLRQAVLKPKFALARGVCHILSGEDKLSESMGALKISDPRAAEAPKITSAMAGSDDVGVEVADSDDERVDPENPLSASEPDAPVKGRKKVVKK